MCENKILRIIINEHIIISVFGVVVSTFHSNESTFEAAKKRKLNSYHFHPFPLSTFVITISICNLILNIDDSKVLEQYKNHI